MVFIQSWVGRCERLCISYSYVEGMVVIILLKCIEWQMMGNARRSGASRFSQMSLIVCLGRIFLRDDSDSSVVESTLFACL